MLKYKVDVFSASKLEKDSMNFDFIPVPKTPKRKLFIRRYCTIIVYIHINSK